MKRKITISSIMILCLALVAGCAVVTTYGVKPKQDISAKDTYSFSVYPNHFANLKYINQFAVGEIEKFMAENGYVSYQILERYQNSSVVTPIIYKVKFSKSPDNIPIKPRY